MESTTRFRLARFAVYVNSPACFLAHLRYYTCNPVTYYVEPNDFELNDVFTLAATWARGKKWQALLMHHAMFLATHRTAE